MGNKETVRNKSDFLINKEHKISFDISKDLVDDFTQYYDLIYEYKNDCLSLSLNYNKSFYSDSNLEQVKAYHFNKNYTIYRTWSFNIGNVINK